MYFFRSSVIVKASNGPRYVVGCRRQVKHTHVHMYISVYMYRSRDVYMYRDEYTCMYRDVYMYRDEYTCTCMYRDVYM